MTRYLLTFGTISPSGCYVEIQDPHYCRFTGSGPTLNDAFADAERKRDAAIARSIHEDFNDVANGRDG